MSGNASLFVAVDGCCFLKEEKNKVNIQPTTSIEGSNIFSPHQFLFSFAHFIYAYVYICTYINATGLMFDSDDRNGEEKEKKRRRRKRKEQELI